MALWQISFVIVPKSSIDSGQYPVSQTGRIEDLDYWQSHHVSPDLFLPIGGFLPVGKSWLKEVCLYGTENSNRFEVLVENGVVADVSFRIDFTSRYGTVLDHIIEFCIHNGFLIIDDTWHPVPMNYESVKAIIEGSYQVVTYRKLAAANGTNLN